MPKRKAKSKKKLSLAQRMLAKNSSVTAGNVPGLIESVGLMLKGKSVMAEARRRTKASRKKK